MTDRGNPIFVREVRQAARVTRTPIVLMAVSMTVTLLIAALGGLLTEDKAPDQIGVAVYRVFFSMSFAVATLVGAALAANSVAAEREGRTFEALVLTALRPGEIARGKFLAALASVGAYLLVIAPAGALAFLFGGVAASEVALAFVYLALFACTFVGLGLAISSKMVSVRSALLVTLLVAFPLAMGGYLFGGIAGSQVASRVWSLVPTDEPIWLPLAYVRGEWGEAWLTTLVLTPLVVFSVAWWLFYEVTVANLKGATDDRSSGLKRWFTVSLPLLAAIAHAWLRVAPQGSRYPMVVFVVLGLFAMLVFSALVFVGEPVVPSGRVEAAARRAGWSSLRRFMGPGIASAGFLQMAVAVVVLGGSWMAIDALCREWNASMIASYGALALDFVPPRFGYAVASLAAFHAFLVGVGSVLRLKRGEGPARVRVFAIALVLLVVPWIVAAVLGALSIDSEALFAATASPLFPFVFARNELQEADYARVTLGWIVLYASVGVLLQSLTWVRTRSAAARARSTS